MVASLDHHWLSTRGTYLDKSRILGLGILCLECVPTCLLVTEEGRHRLFWSSLILLDALLLRLGLHLGLDLLRWGGYMKAIGELN